MNTSKNKIKSLMLVLFFSAATISTASARVCFLPDSTDCGEGDVVGSSNVDVPCQYSNCPAYNTKYQTCYTERIYNNGGVNVECKQVKCSLSKSDCEKKEADPNSSQCCNFDSASGCYYMGSCKLCNRDVYDSEKNLGEGYNCYPCKDKNGTFYNCTAKEKECKDINPDYTSKCADTQIAEEVEGIKDSKGNQCYTCKDKPIGCTYEYRQATTADSCGLTDLNTNYQCMSRINGCMCYTQLQKVSSVDAGAGYVVPYNKISNKSATCVDEKGVTRYQTICQGTRKSSCGKGYEFKPNGCVSDTYNNGFEVKGDEWGDCVKKDCTYEYTRIGVGDTMGDKDFNSYLFNLFNGHDRKTNGTSVYWKGPGDFNKNHNYAGYQMYSIISKDSDICYDEKNTIHYETICPGWAKVACKKKFVPNGCSSEQYVAGRMTIESMSFGDCVRVCDVSEGLYDTEDECKKADPKYPECKSVDNCYVQIKKGWGIHYSHKFENADTRKYNCFRKEYADRVPNSWNVSVRNRDNYNSAKDLDGNIHGNINGYGGEVRYPAGEYKICFDYSYSGIANYIWPNYIQLAKRNGDACSYRLGDNDHQWHPDKNNEKFCSNVNLNTISPSYSTCMIATFEDYEEYYVEGSFNSVSGYSCQRVGSSSPY